MKGPRAPEVISEENLQLAVQALKEGNNFRFPEGTSKSQMACVAQYLLRANKAAWNDLAGQIDEGEIAFKKDGSVEMTIGRQSSRIMAKIRRLISGIIG